MIIILDMPTDRHESASRRPGVLNFAGSYPWRPCLYATWVLCAGDHLGAAWPFAASNLLHSGVLSLFFCLFFFFSLSMKCSNNARWVIRMLNVWRLCFGSSVQASRIVSAGQDFFRRWCVSMPSWEMTTRLLYNAKIVICNVVHCHCHDAAGLVY